MTNEEKILSLLETVLTKVDSLDQKVNNLEQGQANLEQGQAVLESDVSDIKTNQSLQRISFDKLDRNQAVIQQKVTKIELTLENETNHNINLLVDGHKGIVQHLDELKDLNEKVLNLQDDTRVHKVAIKELFNRTSE